MAQWAGQFGGFTHETKVRDAENSLRLAIKNFEMASKSEQSEKLKTVRRLCERLLAVRLKALRARISALTEPGSKPLDDVQMNRLRVREQELQTAGIDEILREFGVRANTV